jgi:predicted nucleotidyltransferase
VPEESKKVGSFRQGRVRLNPEVLAQRVENDLVLVHLDTNQIYKLNDSAARLWELLEADFDLDQAKQQLAQEFEVSMERLEQDIAAVLKSLAENDFIRVER